MFKYYDVNILKYGDEYKVTYINRCVNEDGRYFGKDEKTNEIINDRWLSSISRSKSTVMELALCNEWKYFVTLTLDKNKYDRFNLKKFQKDLSQWVRNYRRLYDADIQYLLIPEMHHDGAWHMHGLMNGIPDNQLFIFELGKHPIDLVYSEYRRWGNYERKFGFNSVAPVHNHSAVSRYITKYISKAFYDVPRDSGVNLYFCTQGLNRAVKVYSGCSPVLLTDTDFENEFVSSKWIDYNTAVEIIGELK